MNISQFIALRYLQSNRENRFFSWVTLLSISGIAIGVAVLIVVLAVISGFEQELRNRFLNAEAHIWAYRYPAGMTEPQKWARTIRNDFKNEIKGISPFIYYETMVKNANAMFGVQVRGINPRTRQLVQDMRPMVHPSAALDDLQKELTDADKGMPLPKEPALIMGSGLMETMKVKVGDRVQLVAQGDDNSVELVTYRIIGAYTSGLKYYDNRLVTISLVAAKTLFHMPTTVTGLEIGLFQAEKSVQIAEKIKDKYNLSYREWQSFNRPMFETIEREKTVIGLIVAMVVLVAAFNILTTIFISVTQKQKDISILKALGASNGQITTLFITQGVLIGLIGSIIGMGLALILSLVLRQFNFIDLPDPYLLKNLPVVFNPMIYLLVSCSSIFLCILAGLYPASIAARVTPVDGIRRNYIG